MTPFGGRDRSNWCGLQSFRGASFSAYLLGSFTAYRRPRLARDSVAATGYFQPIGRAIFSVSGLAHHFQPICSVHLQPLEATAGAGFSRGDRLFSAYPVGFFSLSGEPFLAYPGWRIIFSLSARFIYSLWKPRLARVSVDRLFSAYPVGFFDCLAETAKRQWQCNSGSP
ncbi:hypothetical protein [Geopseudomonas aromaticivorans]